MTDKDDKLQAISDELSEHVIAVKGTLELIDASVEEEDLHNLLIKALKRMDTIQTLSGEMFALLKACLDRMGETKTE
ncbi:MAG: hypothetical protein AMK74_02530 [Nitrospira bacterium SM23_35]|jgi:hypothetical protein|nr:MAG: hypothetical protein AMK74_02530 [Nitrospira bacterium SM23_35]